MITFAEKQGEIVYDWWHYLEQNPDEVSIEDKKYARQLSKSWVTCACGGQDDRIARTFSGEPLDQKLNSLGLQFHVAINNDHFEEAKEILREIQKRSAEIVGVE
jgi:hypothetical protein